MLIWVVGVVDDGFGLICVMSARFVLIFGFNYAVGVDMLWLLVCVNFFICEVLVVVSDSG